MWACSHVKMKRGSGCRDDELPKCANGVEEMLMGSRAEIVAWGQGGKFDRGPGQNASRPPMAVAVGAVA